MINKIDLTTPAALEALVEQWQERIPEAIIIPCSAKEQVGMKGVLDAILERLPSGVVLQSTACATTQVASLSSHICTSKATQPLYA